EASMTPRTRRPNDLAAVARVVDRYDELLATRHRESTCEILAQARHQPELQYVGQPVLDVLRPQFVGVATYRHVCRAATLVARGIATVIARMLADPKLRVLWSLDPGHLRLMRLETKNGAPLVLGRFDGFVAPDGSYSIIEYSNTPGGMIYGQRVA